MIQTTGDKEVIFAYSELQIKEENAICSSKGKKFITGKVYIGLTPKQYTKRILPGALKAMEAQYPDTKIIARGKQKNFKYEDPKVILNSNMY
jgi:hypothetical protein